jgi:hypothetical protein
MNELMIARAAMGILALSAVGAGRAFVIKASDPLPSEPIRRKTKGHRLPDPERKTTPQSKSLKRMLGMKGRR